MSDAKQQYLMTVSERPGFNHTHILQRAYTPGAYPISLTSAEAERVKKLPGVKLSTPGAEKESTAGSVVVLSQAGEVLLKGFHRLREEVRANGFPEMSAEDFVGLARSAAFHQIDNAKTTLAPRVESGPPSLPATPEVKPLAEPLVQSVSEVKPAEAMGQPVSEVKPAEPPPSAGSGKKAKAEK